MTSCRGSCTRDDAADAPRDGATPGASASVATGARGNGGAPLTNLLRVQGSVLAVSSTVTERGADRPMQLVDGDFATAWNSESNDLRGAWIAWHVPPDARVHHVEITAG